MQGRMGDRSCGGTRAGQPLCTSSGPAQDYRPIIDPSDRPIIIEVGINIEAKSNRRTMPRESGTRPIIKDFRLPNHLLAARPFGMTNWLPPLGQSQTMLCRPCLLTAYQRPYASLLAVTKGCASELDCQTDVLTSCSHTDRNNTAYEQTWLDATAGIITSSSALLSVSPANSVRVA